MKITFIIDTDEPYISGPVLGESIREIAKDILSDDQWKSTIQDKITVTARTVYRGGDKFQAVALSTLTMER